MKKKLRKSRKLYSRFRIVLYSNEDGTNRVCTYNDDCNMGYKIPGANAQCNPPESTQDGARNFRCNLAANG
jgi:hypothetical protein